MNFPHDWKLKPTDEIVLTMLLEAKERIVTTQAILDRLYGAIPEERVPNNISQRIHLLRSRVPGIQIQRHYGIGYSIPTEIRKKLLAECVAAERERLRDIEAIATREIIQHMKWMQEEVEWCKTALSRISRTRQELSHLKAA